MTGDTFLVQDGFDLGIVIYSAGFQQGRKYEQHRGEQRASEELFFRKGVNSPPKIHFRSYLTGVKSAREKLIPVKIYHFMYSAKPFASFSQTHPNFYSQLLSTYAHLPFFSSFFLVFRSNFS